MVDELINCFKLDYIYTFPHIEAKTNTNTQSVMKLTWEKGTWVRELITSHSKHRVVWEETKRARLAAT